MVSTKALALDSTWTGALSSAWATPGNWSSGVPGLPVGLATDKATFTGTTPFTTVANNNVARTLATLEFTPTAAQYTITNLTAGGAFTLSGLGIVNNSAQTQLITNTRSFTFTNSADAGSNVLFSNNTGGTLTFSGTTTANNARIANAGTLNISGLTATELSIGSLSGTGGTVTLGAKKLKTGALNTTTSLASVISGVGGALEKEGTGTLTLTGANTYTGDTTVSGGTLQIGAGGTTGSIAGNVLNNAALVFNRSNNLTYAGVVSGSGTLTKSGAGILTLTGNQTYTGGTTISAGTLSLGSGGTTGSVLGNILNNAVLRFNRSDALTYAGVISGSGTLQKQGGGILSLTGTNTFTGITTISTGTLSLGNGGTSGSVAGNITNNATLRFNRSDSLSYGGVISGTGALQKQGAGTLTLSGNNTYSGATTISAGTLVLTGSKSGAGATTVSPGTNLQIGTGGVTGSIAGNVANSGTVTFNRSNALTYAGVLSGTGAVQKQGLGTLTLTGTNTYTGGTTVSGGTLEIGAGGTTGSIAGNVTNDAALVFNRSNNLTYAGVVSGIGTLTKSGAGVLTLTGNQTYTGGTTISAGTLSLGSGGTTGSVLGNILNNAALIFNRSNNLTFAGVISGTGTLEKLGAGVLSLTGTNIYTGTTTVTAGILSLGSGGTTGSVAGNITNNATLRFNRSDSLSYGGVISGTGALQKQGAGTLTLSGNNSYSGATTISAGTLVLTGSKSGAGLTTVSPGTNLQIGAGGVSGSIAGDVANSGTVTFNRSDALTYSGVLSGTGAVQKQGLGTLTLTGTNTYTGLTTISLGTLEIGAGGTTGSIAGNVLNNAALVFNRLDDLTYAGVVSGTGTLTKSGAGVLTLTGNQTYTGGTTISAGTLSLGSGGASGSVLGNILNDGTLRFNRSDNLTYAGVISGTGSLQKQGTGILTLSSINLYTGASQFDQGTVSISQDANLGNGGGLIFNGGVLQTTANLTTNRTATLNIADGTFFTDPGTTLTYNGQITGVGELIKDGDGTMILGSSLNNYSGGTLILNGTLEGTTATIPGDVTVNNGAFLEFNQNFDGTFNGVISGAGDVIKDGSGNVTLTGIQTYTGQTTINQGGIQGTTTSIGNQNVDTTALNTALIFNQNFDGTYSGVLSGVGALVKLGTGTVTLTGNNTYTGGTFINHGGISISSAANLGSSSGPLVFFAGELNTTASMILNNTTHLGLMGGTFNTNSGTTLTLDGLVTSTGSLTKEGAGTLILNNAGNNYTGGTVLEDGVLQAGVAGGFVNHTQYTVNNGQLDLNGFALSMSLLTGLGGSVDVTGTTLTLEQTTDSTYAGSLTGDASAVIQKTNSGQLTLTANSSSYQGTTNINQGTLVMDGQLGGQLHVGGSGTLKGVGVVEDLTVFGTIAPGHPLGALTVNGTYIQQPGSIYQVDLNSAGNSDLINIQGSATINGGTVQLLPGPPPYTSGTRYTILQALGGVTGTYSGLTTPNLPYLFFDLSYDANHVYLDVFRSGIDFSALAITPNQIATANAIETIRPTNPLYVAVSNLDSPELARAAFDLLSGEIHASILGSVVEENRYLRDAVFQHLFDANPKNNDGFWLRGNKAKTTRDTDHNAANLDGNSGGFFIGVDKKVTADVKIGSVAGYGSRQDKVALRLSQARLNQFDFALYSEYAPKRFYLRYGYGRFWYSASTRRSVELPKLSNYLTSEYALYSNQFFSELELRSIFKKVPINPIAQAVYVEAGNNAFTESGGLSELHGVGNRMKTPLTTLGFRSKARLFTSDVFQVKANGLFGWQHAYSGVIPGSTMAFATSANFLIAGTPIATDSALAFLGLELMNPKHQSVKMNLFYQGLYASNVINNGVLVGLNCSFN
jgi:autotransporter-associated beta strand protein